MNKLWVFGDSYSVPFYKTESIKNGWKPLYNEWKGYVSKSYGELVSKELNISHFNLSVSGLDNYTILDNIISSLNKIEEKDIIIIGWSHSGRFRLADSNNLFKSILSKKPDIGYSNEFDNICKKTIEEITINRLNSAYIYELNNYIKLLNFTFSKNIIIHWSPFKQDKDGLNVTLPTKLYNYETVREETNGEIDDGHFSENAHKFLSEQFIEIINDYDSYKPNILLNSFL